MFTRKCVLVAGDAGVAVYGDVAVYASGTTNMIHK